MQMSKWALVAIFVSVSSEIMSSEQCINATVQNNYDCGAITNRDSLTRFEQVGDCVIFEVKAADKWNTSGTFLQKNNLYLFEVMQNEDGITWCNASIITSATGWFIGSNGNKKGSGKPCPTSCTKCENEDAVKGGQVDLELFTNLFIRLFTPLKRHKDGNWFTLIGSLDGKKEHDFVINSGETHEPHVDGVFCAYANDAFIRYKNNSGSLLLKVTYMGKAKDSTTMD